MHYLDEKVRPKSMSRVTREQKFIANEVFQPYSQANFQRINRPDFYDNTFKFQKNPRNETMSQQRPSSVSKLDRPMQIKNPSFTNLSYNDNRRNILNYNIGPKPAPVFAQTVFPDSNIYIKTRPYPNKTKNIDENSPNELSKTQKPSFYYNNNERPASSHNLNPERSRYDNLTMSNKKSPTNRLNNLSKSNVFDHLGLNKKPFNEESQPKTSEIPQRENSTARHITGQEYIDKENTMVMQSEKNISKKNIAETLKASNSMKDNERDVREYRKSFNLATSQQVTSFKSTYNINKILKNSASVMDNLKFKANSGISAAISARDNKRSPKKNNSNHVSNVLLQGNYMNSRADVENLKNNLFKKDTRKSPIQIDRDESPEKVAPGTSPKMNHKDLNFNLKIKERTNPIQRSLEVTNSFKNDINLSQDRHINAFKDQKNQPIKARIFSTKKLEINMNKGDNEPQSTEGLEFEENSKNDSVNRLSPNTVETKQIKSVFFNQSKSSNSQRQNPDDKLFNSDSNLKKDTSSNNKGLTFLNKNQDEDNKSRNFFKTYNKPQTGSPSLNDFITKAQGPTLENSEANKSMKENKKSSEGNLRDSFKNHFNNKLGGSLPSGKENDKKAALHIDTNTSKEKPVEKNIEKTEQAFCSYYTNDVKKAFSASESSYFVNLYRDHFFQSFQAFNIFKSAILPSYDEVHKRKVIQPDIDPKMYPKVDVVKTLIFDLDETLIHCTDSQKKVGEVYLPIRFPTGEQINAGINIRPYAKYALEELAKYYQLVVFTASHSCYANKVVDYLDPTKKLICKRLFRENCIFMPQGVFTKDLRIFENRKLSDLVLIDNSPHTYVFHKSNGIPCIPFYDNYNDKELYKLTQFLKGVAKKLKPGDDFRQIVNTAFKSEKICENLSNFEDVKRNVLMCKN